jgi:BspA type Leucine rich repeat region (6 copies)
MPNTLTNIGNFAFGLCYSLPSLIVPDSVITIAGLAFADNPGLTNVIIGSGVITLGGLAFKDCVNLISVYFRGNAPTPDSVWIFMNCWPTIYCYQGTLGWGPTFGGRTVVVLGP